MKKCSKCGIEKEESEFTKDKRKKSGLGAMCKKCNTKRNEEYRNRIKQIPKKGISHKKCSKCGIEKDKSEFTKSISTLSGLYSQCKECRKEYRLENNEFLKKQQKEKRLKNKPHIKQTGAEYYAKNKDKIEERKRIYKNEHEDEIKEMKRRWFQRNKPHLMDSKRERRANITTHLYGK